MVLRGKTFSIFSSTFTTIQFFDNNHLTSVKYIFIVTFICISPIIIDAVHLLISLLLIFISSFQNIDCDSLFIFKFGYDLFLLRCKRLLHCLETFPLPDTDLQILFLFFGLCSHLLDGILDAQKFQLLIKLYLAFILLFLI